MSNRPTPEECALAIWKEKYPDSAGVLLAGSVLRGEGTASSDLDLVVVCKSLEHAWRDSFFFQGWPVEVFVHDLETLNYFFEKMERPSGVPSLPKMVSEGKEIPGPNPILDEAKDLARKVLIAGPTKWTEKERIRSRYAITDLCDDMKSPRSTAELLASGARLYEVLTEFYFRSKDRWSAKGKSIPRRWKEDSPELGERFLQAFEKLFQQADPRAVLEVSEEILKPYGGWLFEGSKLDAPKEWRLPLEKI